MFRYGVAVTVLRAWFRSVGNKKVTGRPPVIYKV